MNSYRFTWIIFILTVLLLLVTGTEYRMDILLTKVQNIILVTLFWTLFGFFWLGKGRYFEHDEKISTNPIAIAIYLGTYVIALAIAVSSIV